MILCNLYLQKEVTTPWNGNKTNSLKTFSITSANKGNIPVSAAILLAEEAAIL
jgi:hypothetical protein